MGDLKASLLLLVGTAAATSVHGRVAEAGSANADNQVLDSGTSSGEGGVAHDGGLATCDAGMPAGALNLVLYGADPTGELPSSAAIQTGLAAAAASGQVAWLPP